MAHILLQGLIKNLRGWVPHIRRCLNVAEVEFVAQADSFVIKSTWQSKQGPVPIERVFTKEECFGVTSSFSPDLWVLSQTPCKFARAFVAHGLFVQGVTQ